MTNIRAAGKDDTIKLSPPEIFNLEQMISYVQGKYLLIFDDEVIEVTPNAIRSRKKELDANKRKTIRKRQSQF